MVTKPSRLRCAWAGASMKSWVTPMKMPKPMPARPEDTLKRKSDLIMNVSLKAKMSDEPWHLAGTRRAARCIVDGELIAGVYGAVLNGRTGSAERDPYRADRLRRTCVRDSFLRAGRR